MIITKKQVKQILISVLSNSEYSKEEQEHILSILAQKDTDEVEGKFFLLRHQKEGVQEFIKAHYEHLIEDSGHEGKYYIFYLDDDYGTFEKRFQSAPEALKALANDVLAKGYNAMKFFSN